MTRGAAGGAGAAAATRAARRRAHGVEERRAESSRNSLHAEARLGDDLDRALLERAQRRLGARAGEAGADDDRDRVLRHQLAQEREPVHARHLEVEHDHVRPPPRIFSHAR